MSYIYLVISIIFNSLAGILLKYSGTNSGSKSKLLLGAGFIVAAISAIFYSQSLSEINLGVAATVSSATVIIISTISGIILFNEAITLIKIVGTVMVCAGIILVLK
jgi:multidrug transporter EmrE-like cation transporter